MKKFLAILSVAALAATGAQAVTVNLYGTDGGDATVLGKTATFDKDGIAGTIEAFSTHDGDTPIITTNTNGLGVLNGPNDAAYYTSNNPDENGTNWAAGGEIDGAYQDDWLTFTFTTAVRLISLTLSNFNGDAPYGDNAYIEVNGVETNTSNYFYSFGDVISNSFTVRARDYDDEFVVASFTVAPIPLPASALLLMGGLAGFGLMRRRKQIS